MSLVLAAGPLYAPPTRLPALTQRLLGEPAIRALDILDRRCVITDIGGINPDANTIW